MILSKGSKRLLIYAFYEKNGIVDRYVTHLLRQISGCIPEILVVVNGSLRDEGRIKLEQAASHILLRENEGFDIWGYKAGLDYYGWDALERFDEVILMNSTVLGPLHPFAEMFADMDTRDVDFWGITQFYQSDNDPYGRFERGYVPGHIQSYFTAVRSRMLLSPQHKEYWDSLPAINSYEDAVVLHEGVYTETFVKYGFSQGVYTDTEDMRNFSENAAIFAPLRLIRDKKCPVLKRKCFYLDYHHYMTACTGDSAVQALEYIRDNTDYDTDMIWETVVRTGNQQDIYRALALNFILPSKNISGADTALSRKSKAALVFYAQHAGIFDAYRPYIAAMPEDAGIIFMTDTQEKRDMLISLYGCCGFAGFQVLITENTGMGSRPAFPAAVRDIIFDYDYVCFANDIIYMDGARFDITGQSFACKCFGNILASRFFTGNVLAAFENNPRLGLLSPPPPLHADYYYAAMHGDWNSNFDTVKELADKLNLCIDIDPGKAPISPYGGIMWLRLAAIKKMLDFEWDCNGFPGGAGETAGSGCTDARVMEFLFPLVVQDAGFYPARLYSDSFANVELTGLYYCLDGLTKTCSQLCKSYGSHQSLINAVSDFAHHQDILQASVIKAREAEFLGSASWKITAPLRAVAGFIRKLFCR